MSNEQNTGEGFTGTLQGFLNWLSDELVYGGVTIDGVTSSEFFPNREVRMIHTVTGGYSEDESLLGRVQDSIFGMRFWASTHRGGLTTYEIPVKHYEAEELCEWLEPATDVFQTLYRARQVVVEDVDGSTVSVELPRGAQLRWSEETDENGVRNFGAPQGVLRISPIPEKDFSDTFALMKPRENDS